MNRLRYAVVFLCVLVVGGTFLVAGVLKSLDVDGFARDISLHGILGPGPSWFLARLLVPFEIVAGAAVILGHRRRLALVLLLAALVVFIGATAYAWATGQTEGCGCFGRYAARTPGEVILEDVLLAGAAVLALVLGPSGKAGGPRRAWVLVALAIVSSLFTLASPSLPIDNYATALRPGVTIADLGLDRIPGDLGEGDRLLVILALDEAASQNAIPALNKLAESTGLPTLTGLTSASQEKRAEFFWSHAPGFDLLEVPTADLKRLYRRAPRAFRVHNGAVLQVWDRVPPVEDFRH